MGNIVVNLGRTHRNTIYCAKDATEVYEITKDERLPGKKNNDRRIVSMAIGNVLIFLLFDPKIGSCFMYTAKNSNDTHP